MSETVSLTFPDGSVRTYPAGTTGRDVAEAISKSLAKKALAIALNGALRDLSDPVETGAIEIVTRQDPRALELIRHDTAHVMAEAVQELWPGTQVTIGPVIRTVSTTTSSASIRIPARTGPSRPKICRRSRSG